MVRAARRGLLVPRARPARAVDTATRDALIARQRHPARRRRLWRRSFRAVSRLLSVGLGLAALGLVVTVGAYALRTAPLFTIAGVEVLGARRVADAAVLAAARVEPGTSLFALDPEAIQDRVEALPGVRAARVVRRLPNRVTLVVEEREPYALVSVGEPGALFWIDADGHLVGPERNPGAPPLPILSGVEQPRSDADAPLPDRLRAGLALLRAIQRTGDRAAGRISEIDLEGPEGPVLYTIDGVAVRVGHGPWDERLARLDGVLEELEERGERVEWVDLRFRDQVVLRPHPAAAAGPDGRAGATGTRRPTPTGNGSNEARERR